MISSLITALFTLAGLLALAVIAHSLREARAVWVRLMREGEELRAGLALPAPAMEMGQRPFAHAAPRRAIAMPRPAVLRPMPRLPQLQACAA